MDDQWQQLANAIVRMAVYDYRRALRGHGFYKGECERFFRSDWFMTLTGVDGELIMEKLKKEYENERNAHTGNA